MRRPRVLIAGNRKVLHCSELASAVKAAGRMQVAGRSGADVLEEASKHQPDLLLYLLSSADESEYQVLRELKKRCGFSRIVIHAAFPLERQSLSRFLGVCDGCLQGMIPPALLLRALDLLCRSTGFLGAGNNHR